MALIERSFRLCTTSFIYPDHILPNVRKIGHLFDEMELLIFESRPAEGLLCPGDVAELARLGKDLDLTYNIHLPVDVSLTAETPGERQVAADALKLVLERFTPLNPTTCTLHLDMDKGLSGTDTIRAWEDRARHGLGLLVPHLMTPETLCIETLWYDPVHFESLVREFKCSVCADLGHHFKYGYDPVQTFEMFRGKIPLIHFHGVDTGQMPPRDHLGLDRLAGDLFEQALSILTGFTGTLSIEVFGLAPLRNSLLCLEQVFQKIPACP